MSKFSRLLPLWGLTIGCAIRPATAPHSPSAAAKAPGDPQADAGKPGPPSGDASAQQLYSYCSPDASIASYPHFGGQLPAVVADLYPSGGGRDYPVIDAHTHLGTTTAEEQALQAAVGLYSAVHAAWTADNTAALVSTYPRPYLVQFNLGELFAGLRQEAVAGILGAMDAQRAAGAGGIKLFKDFGLTYQDGSGAPLRIDDPRLAPVWERAADEQWACSLHVADPDSWMSRYYPNSPFTKQDLVGQFIRLVEAHPRTVFVAIHLLNLIDSDEELDQLGGYLDRYPNLYADTAARSQYLVGLDQAHVRAFFVAHQDKVLFGTDRTPGEGAINYEEELRYFETTGPTRTFYLNQQTHGLGLPPDVLEKLYFRNALRVFCGHMP